jgi:hypothetical protein
MDIVKITMEGYGCEISRGSINKENENKIEKYTEDVWKKNLYQEIKEEVKINTYFENYGIVKGQIRIDIDFENFIDVPLSVLEVIDKSLVTKEKIEYPKTDEIILTTVQHQEGLIFDVTFVTENEFDLSKLQINKKEITYNIDNPKNVVLFCELYYDGEKIPLNKQINDLRTSMIYVENKKK